MMKTNLEELKKISNSLLVLRNNFEEEDARYKFIEDLEDRVSNIIVEANDGRK